MKHPMLTPRRLRALGEVIDYLWDDEQKDYSANPCEGHIFKSLQILNQMRFQTQERE
jgi:hypothetical protein